MRHINSLSFMDYFKPFNYMVIFMVSFRRELFQFQNLKSWSISSFLFIHVSFMIFETGEGYCLLKKKYSKMFYFFILLKWGTRALHSVGCWSFLLVLLFLFFAWYAIFSISQTQYLCMFLSTYIQWDNYS